MTTQQPKKNLQEFFEGLLNSNALSIIELRAELMLAQYQENEVDLRTADIAILKKIIHADDLDAVHLICAERLGHEDEVAKLREWIAGKADRKTRGASVRLP